MISWSLPAAMVIFELTQRQLWMIRLSSHQWLCGSSTRSSNGLRLARVDAATPIAALRTWYSSRPSCRLRVCELITTGASSSSMVTSKVMIARCRWVKDTIRWDDTWTRLPPGVRQMISRRSTPFAEVQGPLVVLDVGDAEQHRLVVDVELHGLVVGDVDDRLAGAGEAERLLGVPDRPGLVEAVDEGAVGVGLATLLDVAAQAQVAVPDGEQGLGHAEVVVSVLGLGQRPLVDREPHPVQRVADQDRVVGRRDQHHSASSARSVTTTSAPDSDQPLGPDPPVDPDHQPEPAGPARLDAGQRVLEDDRPALRHTELSGRVRERVRGGFAGQVLTGGDVAVDHHLEPLRQAGGIQHRRRVAGGGHDGDLGPPVGQVVEQLNRPRVRLHALVAEHGAEERVLPVAQAADRLGLRAVGRVAVGQGDAAGGQEGADAVVARLPVDVGEVVVLDVGLVDESPLGEEVGEQLLPGPHVDLGGGGEHAVEIEQRRVEIVPVHVDQAYDHPEPRSAGCAMFAVRGTRRHYRELGHRFAAWATPSTRIRSWSRSYATGTSRACTAAGSRSPMPTAG